MIYLFFIACITGTSDCKNVKLTFEKTQEQITPQQCIKNGEIEMVKWFVDHPNHSLVKFRCSTKDEADL